jgi:uncharacterized Tic20 family protein
MTDRPMPHDTEPRPLSTTPDAPAGTPGTPAAPGDDARVSRLSVDADPAAPARTPRATFDFDDAADTPARDVPPTRRTAPADDDWNPFGGPENERYDAWGGHEKPKRGPVNENPGFARARAMFDDAMHPDRRYGRPLSYSTLDLTDEERLWASIAHGSAALSLIAGVLSGGIGVVVGILAPLVIYFAMRTRSDYIAFHALQAFVFSLAATVGVLVLGIVGSILWGLGWIVVALLLLVLVGFLLIPVWLIVGVLLFAGLTILPIAMFVLSLIAAFQTFGGRDYRYPFVAPWVDWQMSQGFLRG